MFATRGEPAANRVAINTTDATDGAEANRRGGGFNINVLE
jgi:hypothetical protein